MTTSDRHAVLRGGIMSLHLSPFLPAGPPIFLGQLRPVNFSTFGHMSAAFVWELAEGVTETLHNCPND